MGCSVTWAAGISGGTLVALFAALIGSRVVGAIFQRLAGQIADEVVGSLPRISVRVVWLATRRIRADEREGYRRQFLGELDAKKALFGEDSPISLFVFSLSLGRAALRIARDLGPEPVSTAVPPQILIELYTAESVYLANVVRRSRERRPDRIVDDLEWRIRQVPSLGQATIDKVRLSSVAVARERAEKDWALWDILPRDDGAPDAS